MTPSDLQALLAEHGIRPIRDRGQHFLLDESVVEAMADAAAVRPGDRVVEIGPGPGILTAVLLARGAEVAAVELDKKLCALLRNRFATPSCHLLEGDALSFSNEKLVSVFGATSDERRATSYKVVANLPYAITSAVFEKFLLQDPKPASITVMIQREVADRILAEPGKMSSLAVLVQTLARPSRVMNVPASSFFPPPKVQSAVIHMALASEAELKVFFRGIDPDRYFSMVRTAFAGKRKQLKNTLRPLADSQEALNKAFNRAKISPQARPEELRPAEWRSLFEALSK